MAQVEIGQIQKKEKEKFLNEKEKKIEKEISKIQNRHNNETQAMELKINSHKNKILREQNQKFVYINQYYFLQFPIIIYVIHHLLDHLI